MKEFSAYDCALDGINLIEAGAGTGKTYNIQTLTARIVLEQAIPITQVLVVTYTRAATAELQERLRKVLDSLLRMLDAATVPEGEEERCRKILDNLRQLPENAPFWKLHIEGSKPQSREETFLRNARFLLRNALRDFDQAAISTIHSFCQRMLTENAFESGLRYGM
ncbi:MAG: UvrD-helicase domain-containing protein, partial [Bacilli bacterium]|nr:UvrD-helicase domain-containing protein [Bacilli bacterium]